MEIPLNCRWLKLSFLFILFFYIPYITEAFTTFEMRFRDQLEKLRSDEQYHLGLRQFQAASIGATTYLPSTNTLLVGANNHFYSINLSLPFAVDETAIEKFEWNVADDKKLACLMKGEEEWECQNFIQVIQYDVSNNKLVVCGTGAQDPVCKIFTDYPRLDSGALEVDGKRKCPFDPTQQSTALFADGALYTATVGDYSGRDSLIYRSSLGQSDIVELRSREADAKWFNSPTFIQSFEVEEWVLVFFREIAVEHVNSGDAIYARVSKVCKSDLGGQYLLEEKWTTYQKARLNCSFPGAYPFYFNYLQDVWMVGEGENRQFYGVFSTGEHEIPGSAICMFDMQAIRDIFNEGQFKEQNAGNWYALPRDMEVSPRPGNCSLDSQRQRDENLIFIAKHPLMDQSVPSYRDPYPIFDLTRADYRLTQIAVYTKEDKNGIPYKILFLGTENGIVLKVALIPDSDKLKSNLLETIYVTPRDRQERVKELEIIRTVEGGGQRDVLIVVTNSSVVELPLQRCENYTTSCACKQDPFCVWNNISATCFELDNNQFDDQDVTNIQDCEEKKIPVPTPTASECLCESPSSPTEKYETTLLVTTSSGPSSSPVVPEVPSTKPVENITTVLFTTVEPGPDKMEPRMTKPPMGGGNEGNKIPDANPSGNDADSNHIGPDSQPSTSFQSSTQQILLILLIVGWVLFLFCVPVIIVLFISNRSKGNYVTTATDESYIGSSITRYQMSDIDTTIHDNHEQKTGGGSQENHRHQNGRSTFHHQSQPAYLHESSTDPRPSLERQSLSLTPSKEPTMERGTPQGLSHSQSLSRKKQPPPVPPKRHNSVLSHNGPRCPPPNGYTRSPRRDSNPNSPTKMRQNSSSSSESEPPPYRPLSGCEDDRRRRPSGASNHEIQEHGRDWYQNHNRSHEQSV